MNRLFAAAGAVVLWAYARACRERNATHRRLARANLLRRVTARANRCHDCGRADGGCDRVVTVDITPDTSKVTKSLQDLVFKANPDNTALWESYFGRKLTPWEREVFSRPGMINKRDIEIPPARTARQGGYIPGTQPVEIAPGEWTLRLNDQTSAAVMKALHDACGEWWREDSGDRYPGRGGW